MSKPKRFQIFHDLVTQCVMADSSHSDLVLLREVLHADGNVCQGVDLIRKQASRKGDAVHLLRRAGYDVSVPG